MSENIPDLPQTSNDDELLVKLDNLAKQVQLLCKSIPQLKLDAQGNLKTVFDPDSEGLATATNQTAGNSALSSIDSKLLRVDTDRVTVVDTKLPLGAATDASIKSLSSKVAVCDTGKVNVSCSVLPDGAATEDAVRALANKIQACNTNKVYVEYSNIPRGAASEDAVNNVVKALGSPAQESSLSNLAMSLGSPAQESSVQKLLKAVGEPAQDASLASLNDSIKSLQAVLDVLGKPAQDSSLDGILGVLKTPAQDNSVKEVVSTLGAPAQQESLAQLVEVMGAPAQAASLEALNSKVWKCNTDSVIVNSLALPSGAALDDSLKKINESIIALGNLVKAPSSQDDTLSWYDSTAPEEGSIIKTGFGKLYQIMAMNLSDKPVYLWFFNSTSETGAPFMPAVILAAGSNTNISLPMGKYFSTGLTWAISSTPDKFTKMSSKITVSMGYI